MIITHDNSQKIAERLGKILHRNVNIMNEEGCIVASTDVSRIGTLHEAAYHLIKQKVPEIDVYPIDQMTGSREGINLPLQLEGKTIGVIGVTGNPDELRDIGLVITEMAEILFSETQQTMRQQSLSRQRRYFLEQLLFSTPSVPDKIFEQKGAFLGVPLHRIRALGVLSMATNLEITDTAAFYDSLLSTLEDYLGKSILLNHLYLGNKLILFLGSDLKSYVCERINEALRSVNVSRNTVFCGIADGCESYIQLNRTYTQAEKALEVAFSTNASQCRVYDELVLELLLAPLPQECCAAFCRRILGETKLNQDELLNFLETYFSCNGSVNAIAQKLFIHKNTVQYKIKKIADETGFDPRKLSDAVLLYLCVWLRKALQV